jgi:DNA-binding LytR/AlgR family response regulator
MTTSCLVVEDQLPAQRILSRYIGELPHLELAGVCGNAFEAMAALHSKPVDLMFLDLNLPRLSGFDFLKNSVNPPKVIVTTAYPEHALEAFDLAVVDYLVKPIGFDRFIRSIDRYLATVQVGRTDVAARPPAAPPAIQTEHFFVKVGSDLRRLCLADLIYLRAEGDYVSLITTSGRLFVAGKMSNWEERLPSSQFARVHKSYIVNLARVERISGPSIVLEEAAVPIGRSYRDRLLVTLGHAPAAGR